MPEVTKIYTDGACSGNPGPGGWGAIAYLSNGKIHEIGGASRATTNNRMEIQAAIEILKWFSDSPQTKAPVLYTDSKYVQDGITKWIKGWKKKNWRTSAGKAVLNQDLWQELDAITQSVNANLTTPVQWCYVKGHAGNEGNERCDAIARAFSHGRHPALMTVTPWADDAERPLASAAVADTLEDTAAADSEDRTASKKSQPTANNQNAAQEQPQQKEDHRAEGLSKNDTSEAKSRSKSKSTATNVEDTPDASHLKPRKDDADDPTGTSNKDTKRDEEKKEEADGTHSATSAGPENLGSATIGSGLKDAGSENGDLNVRTCQQMIERLRITDEIASNGYWITTEELSLLLDLNESLIREKGDRWIWRNWSVLRVRRPESPGLWQLERID